jgi:eukaryotic-like serine/threonine-protein kinase
MSLAPVPPGPNAIRPLSTSPFPKTEPCLSPDERWLAYGSTESNRPEVYVQSFPMMDERTQISTTGGTSPRWARNGRELFFRNGDTVMAANIQGNNRLRASVPMALFNGRFGNGYDVAPDGQRFLMIKPDDSSKPATDEVHVVLNWQEELKQRVPSR